MGETLHVLEPVITVPEPTDQQLAPRVSSLKGKTVLLLDNKKRNAFELLAKVGTLLRSEYGIQDVISVTKEPDYSRGATLEELAPNIGKVHLAVTALGD